MHRSAATTPLPRLDAAPAPSAADDQGDRARRPWPLRALLLAVALAVVAGACGSNDPETARLGGRVVRRDAGTTVPDVPTSTPPTTAAGPTYPVTYAPTTCPFPSASANGLTIECGKLTVPMDRTKPTEGKVQLAVARIHSTSPTPQPDPVLYLEGGPGGSAIAGVDNWTRPPSPILEDRDLILIDQRGTGYSTPRLECSSLRDDDFVSDFSTLAESCRRVMRNQGTDVAAFTTTSSAADLADLRWALKIDQWNLFGISYGTRLALWTMQTQPTGIRSVVLDSVYPPGVSSLEDIPADLQRAITTLAADCAAQPACNSAYPDVLGQLSSAVDKLNAGGRNEGDLFVQELFHALYVTLIMPDIPKAISLANRGQLMPAVNLLEGSGARARNPGTDDKPPPSARTRPTMSEALYHSVECAETAPFTTPDKMRAAAAQVPTQISGYLIRSNLRQLAVCKVWDVPANQLTDVRSDIPTLVLAGTYDPITPPAWGEKAAANLSRSTFVTVTGSGHAAYFAGDCPKQLVKAYFDDPTAPGPDCTGAPPEFTR